MRRLIFTQVIDDRFMDNKIEDKLSYMCKELKEREHIIKWKLCDLQGVSCITKDIYVVDFGINKQLRQDYIIQKANKKTTWDNIYDVVNSVKAVKYTFVNY